jgi:hypothetical protein
MEGVRETFHQPQYRPVALLVRYQLDVHGKRRNMNKGQHQEPLQSEIKNFATAYTYNNFPELKQRGVKINAQECNARRVIHRQQVVGPGEAIDTILQDEEWEVTIPLKVFSQRLILTVYRYHDGSLGVTDQQSLPL